MTAPTSPAHPCVEIRDPEHGRCYVDRNGRAWTVDSRRVPELDAPPALEQRARLDPRKIHDALQRGRTWTRQIEGVHQPSAERDIPIIDSAMDDVLALMSDTPRLEPSLSAEEVGRVLAAVWHEAGRTVTGLGARADANRYSGKTLALTLAAMRLGPSVLAAFEKARGGAR